ncbi:MAG: sugar ABC transporter permease [Clostridia bacterium]|nr:sugar ABC transporter permease [Clostridia bacterium]
MSKKTRNPHDKRRLTKRTLREWGFGYLFIAPWIVGVSIFFLYAMVQSLRFSFSRVELSNGVILHPLENGIFENFVKVFTTDVNFPEILANFGVGLVLQLPVIIAFSLIIALLLNSHIRCRSLFRMIFFLPVIIATGPVMSQLTAQGVSSVPMVSQNALLGVLSGLPEFIYTPINNLFSSLIMILWNSGIQILIFLAGLQKVPRTLYEAAKIDGASGWESFWKITLPTVKPLILLNSIYTVVTLATGGSNEIIELIYTATYTATQGYSYAMAMSWIYTLVVAVILVIVFLLLREKSDKHVVYEQKRIDEKTFLAGRKKA